MPRKLWPVAVFTLVLIAGCGGGSSGSSAEAAAATQDYGTTKQMVIDILHSPEGKSALRDIMKDPAFKEQVAVTETDVAKAVEKTIQSSKGKSFLSQQAQQPEFAATLAKSIHPELTQLLKQLMKDPSYQQDMLVLLKSPEFTKHVQDLMKTPEFRGTVMKIMTEALQTPSFRMQFQDALKKAVADAMAQAGGQGGQQGGGQGQGGQAQGGQSQGGGGGGSQ
ncbi:hypothetical protein GCM10010885_07510 [Alicyclobacillus cellulosilyticus]|uniref:Spore germination GerD central core domain-containing protein n=1 Tax=Alicyclobacillus cellulosilyticus TaxID=1003997 RepID=A0A917K5I1_9BACL|nr:spore germination lipoprotein GerD [Alicyclobacillus cellulosilyticus]GGJ00797.1 hypothetical protein GCM10010885_07510 [Alicyclobacillus cellulosilyticus]